MGLLFKLGLQLSRTVRWRVKGRAERKASMRRERNKKKRPCDVLNEKPSKTSMKRDWEVYWGA